MKKFLAFYPPPPPSYYKSTHYSVFAPCSAAFITVAGTLASVDATPAKGLGTLASVDATLTKSLGTLASVDATLTKSLGTLASVDATPTTGLGTLASVDATPAKGLGTLASVDATPAKGLGTLASVDATTAKGLGTLASVDATPAKGLDILASADATFMQCFGTLASTDATTDELSFINLLNYTYMGINKLHFAHLTNNSHFQFGTEFNTLVTKTGAAALKVEPLYNAWLAHFWKEDFALNRMLKSPLTDKLDIAGHRRDTAFGGLVTANMALLNHFRDEMRDTATRLKTVFDTLGNVSKNPMNNETAAITNLLHELKGTRAADITRAGLTAWVAELEQANNAFEQLITERDNEVANRTDIMLRQVRTMTDAAYRAITKHIDALMEVEGGEPYETFIRRLNAVIERYR